MRLGPVHREDLPELAGPVAGRVVAQLAVLVERMAHVDPEAGDTALEPEAQDVLELRMHLRVPPVEVRLRGREVVQVVAPALAVERPRRPAEDRAPVVRDLVRPDVELGPLAEPRVPVGRVVRDEVEEDPDAAGAPPPPRAGRRPRPSRSRGGRRCSRRRRTPSRRSATDRSGSARSRRRRATRGTRAGR